MSLSVKCLTLALLGLVLAAWFWAGSGRNTAPADVPAPAPELESPAPAVSQRIAPVFRGVTPGPDLGADHDDPPEDSGVEEPAAESAWAGELRALKELTARDPEAALEFVSQLEIKEERLSALKEVCLLAATNNPARALEAAWQLDLGKLAEGPEDGAALETLARHWAAADLPGAFAWASALPADEEGRRDRLMKAIAACWSETAPAEAAGLVAADITPDSQVQLEAAMTVLRQWAARDGDGASAWVELFPEGWLRDRGRAELAKAKAE